MPQPVHPSDSYEAAIDLNNLRKSEELIRSEVTHYLALREQLIQSVQRNPNWSIDTLVNMICEIHDTSRAFMDYYASYHAESIKDVLRAQAKEVNRSGPRNSGPGSGPNPKPPPGPLFIPPIIK